MPNLTLNYNLKKPLNNENGDISIINENMDIIDTQLNLKGDMKKSTYDPNNNGIVEKAEKLNTARTITLSGAITGNITFDGSANVTIDAVLAALSAAKITSGTMSPARIAQDASNRFVTDSEKSTWNGKAPTNHAYIAGNYGAGTTELYGHVKIIDDLTAAAYVPGEVLSSYQGKVIDNKISAKASTVTYALTIATGSWSGSGPWSKAITISGILATDTPIVDVVLSATVATAKLQLEAWAKISRITTAANSITVYCYDEIPVTAIPIQLKVVR